VVTSVVSFSGHLCRQRRSDRRWQRRDLEGKLEEGRMDSRGLSKGILGMALGEKPLRSAALPDDYPHGEDARPGSLFCHDPEDSKARELPGAR